MFVSHQLQALTFMQRRERGWALQGLQSEIWRIQVLQPSSNVSRYGNEPFPRPLSYINNVTDELQDTPPEQFRGGIIADEMGLGKTLTMIALIASDKDSANTDVAMSSYMDIELRTTLVVVRAPCMSIDSV